MALEMQAALEQAVVNALRASQQAAVPGLGYTAEQCARTYDGQPPPITGPFFVAVWGKGGRGVVRHTPAVEETLTVYVTVTVQCYKPFDRWVEHRDDLEARVNRVIEVVAPDAYDYRITNAAEVLAGLDGALQPVGFVEGLNYQGLGDIEEVGPSWFQAEAYGTLDVPAAKACGLTQQITFGGNKRVRKTAYLAPE